MKASGVCASWFALLFVVCTFPIAVLAQPAWETLTLPAGIAGKAELFFEETRVGKAGQQSPDQRHLFEIHREWVRGELYEPEGGFGWQLRDFTMDTYDESILYNFKSMRGTRMQRLAVYGNSRADIFISPIQWIRMLHVRSELGESIQIENNEDGAIYTCQGARGYGKFRVFVDSAGRVVRAEELFPDSTEIQSIYEYQDWVALGEAGEHPQTVRSVIYRNKQVYKIEGFIPDPSMQEPLYTVTKILEMKPLSEDAEPTGYVLPADALIHDYIDEVVRDGNMNIIGKFPKESWGSADTATRENPPFRLSSGWLAGAGVLMLVSAATIWEVRRRRG